MFITSSSESIPVYEGFVDPTPEGLEILVLECFNDFEYESTLEQSGTGSGKSKWGSVNQILKDLFARLKAWFDQAVQRFNEIFNIKALFVKKYKDTILKKSTKGFTYTSYPYEIAEGEAYVYKVLDGVEKVFEELEVAKDFKTQANNARNHDGDMLWDFYRNVAGFDALKLNGNHERSMINEAVKFIFRGREKHPIAIEEFAGISPQTMMDSLLNYSKTLTSIRKAKDKSEKFGRKLIDYTWRVDNESRKQGIDSDKIVARSVTVMEMAKIVPTLTSAYYQISVEYLNTFHRVLREFLAFKPEADKEVKLLKTTANESAIFEQASSLI